LDCIEESGVRLHNGGHQKFLAAVLCEPAPLAGVLAALERDRRPTLVLAARSALAPENSRDVASGEKIAPASFAGAFFFRATTARPSPPISSPAPPLASR